MRTLLWIIVVALMAFLALSMNYNLKPSVPSTQHDAILHKIRLEPKVKEVIITDVNVMYVSVVDDGTKRDGYAIYLCSLIEEMNANINRVKVVKAGSTKDANRDNAYGVLLGESWCN